MQQSVHENSKLSFTHLSQTAGIDTLSAVSAEKRMYTNQMRAAEVRKKFFGIALFALSSLISTAQTASYSPGVAAKFGIDGDVRANTMLSGTSTFTGTHDWFASGTGSGLGLISTDSAAEIRSMLQAGQNLHFSKRMVFAPYTAHDGILMMDAVYSRDYMGNDKTAFKSSTTKNTANPSTWGTDPNGVNVGEKSDIIDSYVSMRRNGTSINPLSPSDLIVTMGLTTLSTEGDHYSDFEFYRQRIAYDATTGLFSNSGPNGSGGHSVWKFKTDGTLTQWGDLCLSFSFNGTNVLDIAVYIWVEKKDYQNVNPAKFDFVANSFMESMSVSGYGYARIAPNGGGQIAAWATVSKSIAQGPAWGTHSKELGTVTTNNFVDNYSVGQFAEAALNLTALGVDPVFSTAYNPCDPPFTRFITKTRSSPAFTAALEDFTGPYEFLDVPFVSAKTVKPACLTCAVSQVTLTPESIVPSATYSWTTLDGNIVSGANTATPVVNKAGYYTLTATAFAGCGTDTYTVKVEEDRYKPQAVASVLGVIQGSDPTSYATLKGDTTFSGLVGTVGSLAWQWTGPDAFTSSTKDATTTKGGEYELKVTATNSGCFSTAKVMVDAVVLPVKFRSFAATLEKKASNLTWSIAEERNLNHFVVERSANGQDYKDLGVVFADNATWQYSFRDNSITSGGTYYYRIKAQEKSGNLVYSQVRIVRPASETNGLTIAVFPNPAKDQLQITLPIQWQGKKVKFDLVNANGVVMRAIQSSALNQTETIAVSELPRGLYIVKVTCESELAQQRFIKE